MLICVNLWHISVLKGTANGATTLPDHSASRQSRQGRRVLWKAARRPRAANSARLASLHRLWPGDSGPGRRERRRHSTKAATRYIYFAVNDVEAVYRRAQQLQCLSTEDVHGESGGDLVKRPWGERSFYAHDPWGNGLCCR